MHVIGTPTHVRREAPIKISSGEFVVTESSGNPCERGIPLFVVGTLDLTTSTRVLEFGRVGDLQRRREVPPYCRDLSTKHRMVVKQKCTV